MSFFLYKPFNTGKMWNKKIRKIKMVRKLLIEQQQQKQKQKQMK